MGQVRPAGGRAKKLKERMHSQLPCLLSDFYPRNIRMTRNETSADRRLHPRTGDAIFFLNFASFRVFLRAQFFRESQRFLRKPRSQCTSITESFLQKAAKKTKILIYVCYQTPLVIFVSFCSVFPSVEADPKAMRGRFALPKRCARKSGSRSR